MAPTATQILAMISGSLDGGWNNKTFRGRQKMWSGSPVHLQLPESYGSLIHMCKLDLAAMVSELNEISG